MRRTCQSLMEQCAYAYANGNEGTAHRKTAPAEELKKQLQTLYNFGRRVTADSHAVWLEGLRKIG